MEDTNHQSGLQITRRRLPHWTLEGSTYFITFRLAAGTLTHEERRIVLDHIGAGHARFYSLLAAVVMPDHVHLVLRPIGGCQLSRIMRGIKGVSANLLNRVRGTTGKLWQDESYDRIVRNADEFHEKWNYMYNNPAKAGLCMPGETYDGWLSNTEFSGL